MDEKHSQVVSWLTKLMPNGFPDYELCESTIDILYNMMKKNQQYDEHLMMAIADVDAKRLGYECEAKRIEHILKDLEVNPSTLSSDVSGKLKALVNVTQQVGAQDANSVSIPIGMCELLKEISQTGIILERHKDDCDLLIRETLSCQKIMAKLETILPLITNDLHQQDEELRTKSDKKKLSESGIKEHQDKICQLDSALANNGYSLEITHEELNKQYQHLKVLKGEFLELKTKLDNFHELPTDNSQVAERLCAAKAQLSMYYSYHIGGSRSIWESKNIKSWENQYTKVSLTSKRKKSNDKSTSFDDICEETLESLAEHFDEIIVKHLADAETDVTLSDGVLTVKLGNKKGTYVINKQGPNKQIWLSSPISGPKRYDFMEGQWIYRHDGMSLHELLTKEMSETLSTNVDFTQCYYGPKERRYVLADEILYI